MVIGATEVQANTFPFEVETVIPENQVDKEKTYFDLKLEKSQQQTVEVILRNMTPKEITVGTTFNRLTTNSNGVMEYEGSKEKPDKSLLVDIETLAKVENEKVVIKANSEEKVKIAIQAPAVYFPGILAGGLTFKLLEDGKEERQTDDTMGVANEYGYDVALILHGNVGAEELPTELVLSTVGIVNNSGRNVIAANLQNPQPKALKGMTIETKVMNKKSGEVVLENKRTDLEVAPNSNFDYGIPLEGAILDAGDYELKLLVTADGGKWELGKEFAIKGVEAEQIRQEASPIVQKNHTIWYVLVSLFVVIVLAILWILYHQKNQVKFSGNKSKTIAKKRRTVSKR